MDAAEVVLAHVLQVPDRCAGGQQLRPPADKHTRLERLLPTTRGKRSFHWENKNSVHIPNNCNESDLSPSGLVFWKMCCSRSSSFQSPKTFTFIFTTASLSPNWGQCRLIRHPGPGPSPKHKWINRIKQTIKTIKSHTATTGRCEVWRKGGRCSLWSRWKY